MPPHPDNPPPPAGTLNHMMNRAVSAAYRRARRIVIFVIGATVVLLGVALLVLPGPGIVVMVLGLAILATEFVWARVWLKRLRSGARHGWRRTRRWLRRTKADAPASAGDSHGNGGLS